MTTVDSKPAVTSGDRPPPRRPRGSAWPIAFARNTWRQLTSMRTALVLLFLLALAAVPGSVLPQRNVGIEKVQGFYQEHPDLAPWLERIGAFDVFGSAWFAAIYVLLFTSLVGCVIPRLRDHVRALGAVPPAVPARLDRLPQHAVVADHDGDVAAVAARLKAARWRVAVRGDTVSAEKGYLKETGNLLFHFALLAVLAAVGLGSWYGWHGNRILVAGPDSSFCNTIQQYDESKLGPRVADASLPPFCMRLDEFAAGFQENGQPKSFKATVTVEGDGDRPERTASFTVNDPLRLDGASVYLLGHGYAPILRFTDRYGQTQTTQAPFLSFDPMQTSEGAIMFPDANIDPNTGVRDPNAQVGFTGLYLPTAPEQAPFVRSQFPAENNPALLLSAYRGNLGLDAGIPGSVYKLDQGQIDAGRLKPVGDGKLLKPGETWQLDDGSSVTFVGTRPYATLSIRHDPGQGIALVASVLALVGLMGSLFGRRRRIFFRLSAGPPGTAAPGFAATPGDAAAPGSSPSPTSGSRVLEAGGLPRTDYPGFADEFQRTVAAVAAGEKT